MKPHSKGNMLHRPGILQPGSDRHRGWELGLPVRFPHAQPWEFPFSPGRLNLNCLVCSILSPAASQGLCSLSPTLLCLWRLTGQPVRNEVKGDPTETGSIWCTC